MSINDSTSTQADAVDLATNLATQGRTLRLAMALVDGASIASEDRQANVDRLRTVTGCVAGRGGMSSDDPVSMSDEALTRRLQQLVRTNGRNLAEQLTLILLIEERELWRKSACRDVLHWMDRVLGIGRISGLERLRVARALRSLTVIESLFALGKLSWSKVRELTRVATPASEQALAAAALDLSASETVELCRRWRHDEMNAAEKDDHDAGEGHGAVADEAESRHALRASESRSLTWREFGTGTTRITLDLPHHSAAEFLKVLEAQEDLLREDEMGKDEPLGDEPLADEQHGDEPAGDEKIDHEPPGNEPHAKATAPTPRQRRADAAMLMSTKALAHAGEPVATADRYRVFVNIDARLLGDTGTVCSTAPSGELVAERPAVPGFGPIAVATARRLASQAKLTVIATDTHGDVVATGRDTRLFSAQSIRAITARDRCCQMPGCTRTRWLQAHHVVPWSEGGETAVSNGALVCGACHIRLHEGRLRLERVNKDSVALAHEDALILTTDEQAEARAMIAAVQRFRLVDREGRWLAGPRRSLRRDDVNASTSDGSSSFTRVNREEPLSQGDQLEQYRVARE